MYEDAIIVEKDVMNNIAKYTVEPNIDLVSSIQHAGNLSSKTESSAENEKKEAYRDLIRKHTFYGFKVESHFVLSQEYYYGRCGSDFGIAHSRKEANSRLENAAMRHAKRLQLEIKKKIDIQPKIIKRKAVKQSQ